jgi:hypothetical protein
LPGAPSGPLRSLVVGRVSRFQWVGDVEAASSSGVEEL